MRRHRKLVSWIIVSALAAVIFCAVFFFRKDTTYRGWSDACFVSFAVTAAIGLLRAIVRLGTFDTLSYVAIRFGESFKKGSPRSFEDAYHYHSFKAEKRARNKFYFWPYAILSVALLILTVAFDILSSQ